MNAILGSRIKNLRESKGLTQEQIADKLNCTRQRYAILEKGLIDISYNTISKIAQILGVEIEEITSAANNICKEEPMFRNNGSLVQEDKFEYILNMIDTFYAHRKLYNSVRQVDINE